MDKFLTNISLVLTFLLPGCQHFLFSQQSDHFNISVHQYDSSSLKDILHKLTDQYPVRIYTDPAVDPGKSVGPAEISDLPALEGLNKLLTGTGYKAIEYLPYIFVISEESRLNQAVFNDYFIKKKTLQESTDEVHIIIGRSDSINRSGKAIVRGLLINGNTDSTVANISIKVMDLDTIIKTNRYGMFEFNASVGIHTLTIEAEDFQPMQRSIKVYSDGNLIIKLFENSLMLPEVVIGGSAQQRLENAQAGQSILTVREIKRLPSLLGETDVLKALLTLPGVSNTGEVGSGYNVRGGNIDQNLILQDGVFYLNPSHVLGLFSAFNPDAIKNVTLFKGNVPAQYGGRTASVLDIKLKDPDEQKWAVFGGIGPISSKLFVEGPIIRDRTSFFIGTRFTYSDWVLKLVRDPNLKNSSAGFYDLNFKLAHRLSATSSIQLSGYQSKDDFNYAHQFGYGWQTRSFAVTYIQQLKNQVLLSGSLIYSRSKNNFVDQTTPVNNLLQNGLTYYKSKWNLAWQAQRNHTINAGLEGIRYLPLPQSYQAVSDQDVTNESVSQSKGDEGALYINDEFAIHSHLKFSLGLRWSAYRNSGSEKVFQYMPGVSRIAQHITGAKQYAEGETIKWYHGSEPRASIAYLLSDHSSVKLAYNRLYQYIHLISNTAAATPVDLWQMSNSFLAPQRADNFSTGYFKNLNSNEWETSFEVYYKKLEHLVEYKDFAKLLRNDHLETELFPVKGKSYGAELYIKRLKNNPTGYISYTWSRSLRQSPGVFPDEVINHGNWYASNFDKPHNLNIVFDLQLRKTMFFSANFVYSTGRPQTTPISEFYLGDGGIFLNYSQRNSIRIPDYHRLDLSYTITRGAIRKQKNKGSLTLAVYNFYARKNAFSVFYRRSPGEPLVAYKLAVLGTALPSITYNFQF